MKMLTKSVPAWALILAIIACASVTAAALIVMRPVSLTMVIKAKLGMQIYQPDKTTILTAIDLGEFYRSDTKRFPNTPDTYWLKNTEEGNIWYAWDVGEWPTGVNIKVYVDGALLAQKTKEGPLAGGLFKSWYFEIEVTSTAAFGTFKPKLEWYAYDSATG